MVQWVIADGSEMCSICGEYQEAGWDITMDDGDVVCEPCVEDTDYDLNDLPDLEDDNYLIDGVGFSIPGGNSALRAETKDNPRNLPCPECHRENVLTPLDMANSYVCDSCADQAEGSF